MKLNAVRDFKRQHGQPNTHGLLSGATIAKAEETYKNQGRALRLQRSSSGTAPANEAAKHVSEDENAPVARWR